MHGASAAISYEVLTTILLEEIQDLCQEVAESSGSLRVCFPYHWHLRAQWSIECWHRVGSGSESAGSGLDKEVNFAEGSGGEAAVKSLRYSLRTRTG